MKAYKKESKTLLRIARFAAVLGAGAICLAFGAGLSVDAADFEEGDVEWRFESGLDRVSFAESFKTLSSENFRITDIESFRSGRSASVTTIWRKLPGNDRWAIEMSKPIGEFIASHKKNQEKGYSLVEFEIDRKGATLHFSGVWVKSAKELKTEFNLGMESIDFSNRYGEMADRGYRLIDFEAYESNGKPKNAAIWVKNENHELRFYRVIEQKRFVEIAADLEESGFRMLDIEGYVRDGKFVFAAEWVRRKEGQESKYAFDLLADEFYRKNSEYMNKEYRLTEFEVYENNGTTYYAGSWFKPKPADYIPLDQRKDNGKKKMSLKEFRSDDDE